ncbi:hypothetical protein BKA80DRAFT_278489 [Phyllosticta citrichinensis]
MTTTGGGGEANCMTLPRANLHSVTHGFSLSISCHKPIVTDQLAPPLHNSAACAADHSLTHSPALKPRYKSFFLLLLASTATTDLWIGSSSAETSYRQAGHCRQSLSHLRTVCVFPALWLDGLADRRRQGHGDLAEEKERWRGWRCEVMMKMFGCTVV